LPACPPAAFGIVDDDGIAVLSPPGATGSQPLCATGFGPGAARLAADLAAQVRAWDEAGRPGVAGLRVDAYPRSAPDQPCLLGDELVIERPATRFVMYRT